MKHMNLISKITLLSVSIFSLASCSNSVKLDFSYSNIESVAFAVFDNQQNQTIRPVGENVLETFLNALKSDFDLTEVKNASFTCARCHYGDGTQIRIQYKQDKYSPYFSSGETIVLSADYVETSTGNHVLKNYYHNKIVIDDLYAHFVND